MTPTTNADFIRTVSKDLKKADVLKRIPRWSSLRKLGNSRLLRSSYVWLVIVPVIAKILSRFDQEITLSLLGATITFTLGLPFSWKMFYFSAVACAIASLIYSLFCPKMVSDHGRFSEFQAEGKGQGQIKDELLILLRRLYPGKKNTLASNFINRYCKHEPPHLEMTFLESQMLLEITEIQNDKLADAFYFVLNRANSVSPLARVICLICYVVAFLLILVVLGQGFYYVCLTA